MLPGHSSASLKKGLEVFLEAEEEHLVGEAGGEEDENKDVVKVIYIDSHPEEVYKCIFLYGKLSFFFF